MIVRRLFGWEPRAPLPRKVSCLLSIVPGRTESILYPTMTKHSTIMRLVCGGWPWGWSQGYIRRGWRSSRAKVSQNCQRSERHYVEAIENNLLSG